MEDHISGRAFIQHLKSAGEFSIDLSHFFETLKSKRRLSLVSDVAGLLSKMPAASGNELLLDAKELDEHDLYAGDGHSHKAAVHDKRFDGAKQACGHVYLLNLRSQALVHLAVADQSPKESEHDMHVLKRTEIDVLRQGAPKRRKVLIVWDKAGIDFRQWHKWKSQGGVYFLSREKDNMKLERVGIKEFNSLDPRNEGVLSDELAATSQGVAVRRIKYMCPVRMEEFSFLTSEYNVPPGLLVHLYRKRWDIEKVFDELKNKLNEKKAWATSATAKEMQAQLLCITHNLILLCEKTIEKEKGIHNKAEVKRREARASEIKEIIMKNDKVVPVLLVELQRITVRSIKFIRWLRAQLFHKPCEEPSWDQLIRLYAHL